MPGVKQNLLSICELIVDCEHKTAPTQETGYPSIRTPNIGRGRLLLDGVNRVSEDTYREWSKRAIPQADDLILAREAPIGNVAIVPKNLKVCLGQRTVLIRPNKKQVCPMFLVYFMLGDETQGKLLGPSTGATVSHLNMRDIRNLEIPELPPLPTQHKIADVLSAYDDLIEVNQQRIALLERAGREIYREWFVRLRFPGHECTANVDGVPEGWESTTYSNVFNFLGGFAFKSKTYQPEGRFGIVTIKNVHNAQFIPECASRLNDVPEKMKEHCLLATGDILLSLTGDVGRCCIVFGERYLLNQRVAKVDGSTDIPKSFTYWTFSNETTRKKLENLAHGAAQSNLSPVTLGNREFIKPASIVLEFFGEIADPIFWQIATLNLATIELRRARDLLLPRLMSGQLAL